MPGSSSSSRLSKRFRASDAASDQVAHAKDDRLKRRRFSRDGPNCFGLAAPGMSQESTDQGHDASTVDEIRTPWSSSQPVAGQYNNIEPVFSSDEEYLFLATGSAVRVYSTVTSILVRTLHMGSNQSIIGYKICPIKQERLYVFTANGSVRTWEWTTGKQISHWDMHRTTISVDFSLDASDSSANPTIYYLCEREDGKREIRTFSMRDEKPSESVILETTARVSQTKVSPQSQTIIAYGGHRLLLGITYASNNGEAEHAQYTWRETILPVTITCLDIRKNTRREVQGQKDRNPREQLDLVVGEAGGSILIYQDMLGFFLTHEGSRDGNNSSAARRLHWHRGPVNSLRWSRDGNYIISGGNESVLVLWQLDTGRKQFLPHLSSPICNIVISPTGNSYAVKLADNCVMVLSARELAPYATITGLQLSPKMVKPRYQTVSLGASAAAVLHPRYPHQLLVAVPASRQSSQDGHSLANSVLQTFDIHANTHISRQALARTNTTVLKISPEGSEVTTPDIRYLDISQDGKWLATLDSWTPQPQDIKALGLSDTEYGMVTDYEENFLKFWRWNGSSNIWELVTRIDGPHVSNEGPAPVLGLVSRPRSHEFVTIGTDERLRIWCPNPRRRNGLKTGPDAVQQMETWKCRNVIHLKRNLSHRNSHLTTTCLAFSEDGSVLAVCLPSGDAANPGLVVLIDAQECVVRYSRIGSYCGEPCAVKFLGRQLLIATRRSVSVWDTVDDLVRIIESPLDGPSAGKSQQLLAVSPSTGTFAITVQRLQNSTRKSRSTQFPVKVYDIETLAPVFSSAIGKCPVALLSDTQSGDYVVVDAAASVQRFGCPDRAPQPMARSHELSALSNRLNSGLVDLFGGQGFGMQPHSLPPATTLGEDEISEQAKGLSGVFGEVPSFVLPSASVLFRNVVQSLLG